jgi:hypothetical protein
MGCISTELIVYLIKKKAVSCLFTLSPNRGWGVIKIYNGFYLFKVGSIKFYTHRTQCKSNRVNFLFFFLGLHKNYLQHLQLKGMGFKILVLGKHFFFKLGFSHKIIFIIKNSFHFFYERRQLLTIESRSLYRVKVITQKLQLLRKLNNYKKKGIYFKGYLFKPKLSSKKAKI